MTSRHLGFVLGSLYVLKYDNRFQSNVSLAYLHVILTSQPAVTCSKLTTETIERGEKYVQS